MLRFIIQIIAVLSFSMCWLSTSVAQTDTDGAGDPFSDFSEFEAGPEEEKDINFFNNGRFINVGMLLGGRDYTGTFGKVFSPQTSFGFFLAYFFDLRFAMQFSYISGQGNVKMNSLDNSENISASTELETMQIDFKYYLNTDNVTKGLANFNPYLLLGFSMATQVIGSEELDKGLDSAQGLNAGIGFEVPFLKNQMFIGGQASYHLISFKAEGGEQQLAGKDTGIIYNGDVIALMGILGVNF